MLPPFNNLLIELLKGSALVSTVTVADMTFAGNLVRLGTNESAPIYTLLLVLYFVMAFLLTRGMRLLERRAKANVGQGIRTRRSSRAPRAEAGAGQGVLTAGGAR